MLNRFKIKINLVLKNGTMVSEVVFEVRSKLGYEVGIFGLGVMWRGVKKSSIKEVAWCQLLMRQAKIKRQGACFYLDSLK